jgi:hypothetical protein
MAESPTLEVIRGSDHTIRVVWRDSLGAPLDFTGMTLSLFDISSELTGRLTGTLTLPAEGTFEIKIEGDPPLRLGLHSFRIKLASGGDTLTSRRIYIKVE